jgi:nitroreductase
MDAITALTTRNSASRLTGDAPGPAERAQIFRAALRAPDHAHLRPWHFLVVEGEARVQLGAALVAAARRAYPELSEQEAAKLRGNPLRAPLVVIVVARTREHPKVPEVEQLLSAGAAAQNMLVAAHALGFGAMWRTGPVTYLPELREELGLLPNDRPVGFLYLGEVDGTPKPLPDEPPETYFSTWPA